MSKITRDHILKLARLSKLELSEAEITLYQKEISAILAFVEQLDSVDVSNLKPTYQVSGIVNGFRQDVVREQQATADSLLAIVPKKKDRYIQVGKMI